MSELIIPRFFAGVQRFLGLTVDGFYASLDITMNSPLQAFEEFSSQSLFSVFKNGFDFSAYIEAHGSANLVLTIARLPETSKKSRAAHG